MQPQQRDYGVVGQEPGTDLYTDTRRHMVDVDLAGRGIVDPLVLAAMEAVPRHRFLDESQAGVAYADRALPIGGGQTISQPYIVAFTAQALALTSGNRVLEVGTGSGYAAAVLATLETTVITVERDPKLAAKARARLKVLGYERIEVITADGSSGSPDQAPFDAISVAAAAPVVPDALINQLRIGGRLVAPVGGRRLDQVLVRVIRTQAGNEIEALLPVAFVPLVGEAGWPES